MRKETELAFRCLTYDMVLCYCASIPLILLLDSGAHILTYYLWSLHLVDIISAGNHKPLYLIVHRTKSYPSMYVSMQQNFHCLFLLFPQQSSNLQWIYFAYNIYSLTLMMAESEQADKLRFPCWAFHTLQNFLLWTTTFTCPLQIWFNACMLQKILLNVNHPVKV